MDRVNNHALSERIESLEQKVDLLQRLLLSQGVNYSWLPPGKAEAFVNQKPETIRCMIRDAEEARLAHKRHPLKYGVHYRRRGSQTAKRPSWEIQIDQWNSVKSTIAS